jgi:hypothetical protein
VFGFVLVALAERQDPPHLGDTVVVRHEPPAPALARPESREPVRNGADHNEVPQGPLARAPHIAVETTHRPAPIPIASSVPSPLSTGRPTAADDSVTSTSPSPSPASTRSDSDDDDGGADD